jgi:hypothetical protein
MLFEVTVRAIHDMLWLAGLLAGLFAICDCCSRHAAQATAQRLAPPRQTAQCRQPHTARATTAADPLRANAIEPQLVKLGLPPHFLKALKAAFAITAASAGLNGAEQQLKPHTAAPIASQTSTTVTYDRRFMTERVQLDEEVWTPESLSQLTRAETALANVLRESGVVDLTAFALVNDAILVEVAAIARSQLTRLVISTCKHISPSALAAVARACDQLEVLEMRECDCRPADDHAVGLGSALEHMRRLRILDARNCAGVDEAALAMLPHCAVLSELRLAGCAAVTDSALDAIGRCTLLTVLDLSHASPAPSAGLQRMLCSCTNLTSLRLVGNASADAALCRVVAHTNRTLEELHVSLCPKIDSLAITALARSAHFLRVLDVSMNRLITDGCMEILCDTSGIPVLEELLLSSCIQAKDCQSAHRTRCLSKAKVAPPKRRFTVSATRLKAKAFRVCVWFIGLRNIGAAQLPEVPIIAWLY